MPHKNTLRLLLVICLVLLIILSSAFCFSFISKKLTIKKRQELLNLANSQKSRIEKILLHEKNKLQTLASEKELIDLVKLSVTQINSQTKNYSNQQNQLDTILNNYKKISALCSDITVYNKNKEYVTGSTSITLEVYRMYQHSFSTKKPVILSSSNEFIIVSCPIFEANTTSFLGFILVNLDTSFIEDIISSVKIKKTGFGFILDNKGNLIYSPHDQQKELTSNILFSFHNFSDLDKKEGYFEFSTTHTQQLLSFTNFKELDWTFIMKQDKTEITPFWRIAISSIFWSILIVGLIFFSFYFYFTKYYRQPFFQLNATLKDISEGNLSVSYKMPSTKEYKNLSDHFNKIVQNIKSSHNHIEYLGHHDSLTHLPNKSSFSSKLHNLITSEPGIHQQHGIYLLDMDNFKAANDTLGHDYGDTLLVLVGERLRSLMKHNDLLARSGGDEFLILRNHINGQEDAVSFANQILTEFQQPFTLEHDIIYVTFSIGIALFPDNGTSHQALVKKADIAMYFSKNTGRNKFALFDQTMEQQLNRNTSLLDILRHAIENKEISILYQPQINIRTFEITGFEALMRIQSKKLGHLSPSEFIPLAEESGLIIDLGYWMLYEACKFNKTLLDAGFQTTVAVNISSVQLNHGDFIKTLLEILKRTQLPTKYLELEITESTVLSSLVKTSQLLVQFQQLGINISLDDFGTGYSSLHYLTSLPINTLKIDKTFIDNICINEKDNCIATSIIDLAHKLNIHVIAEGVEDFSQLELLKNNNCDTVQGFFFSRPLEPTLLTLLLEKRLWEKEECWT